MGDRKTYYVGKDYCDINKNDKEVGGYPVHYMLKMTVNTSKKLWKIRNKKVDLFIHLFIRQFY